MSTWTAGHSAALTRAPVLGLNFHVVTPQNRARVRRDLERAATVGPALDLDRADADRRPSDVDGAAGRTADGAGPRVLLAWYDGHRDTTLFGAEECHRLGLRAYVFPIFASRMRGAGTLTDADLADLATVHEIGFHSFSHVPARGVSPATLAREVVEPMERLAAATGRSPRIAAWQGGARFDPTVLADRKLRELGVRYVVSNWSVERVPPADAP